MKNADQLRDLARNLSRKTHAQHEILVRTFMFERFLERISVSKYKHNFILKGGVLISSMVGIDARTTMDMDASLQGYPLTEAELTKIIEEVLRVRLEDNVDFIFQGMSEIRKQENYSGYRVKLRASFGDIWQNIKIDVATGDIITPKEIEYGYKLMFEDRVIDVMAYNVETILSEKLSAVIALDIANSRMKDFYDIYLLTKTRDFDSGLFCVAFANTLRNKGIVSSGASIIETITAVSKDVGIIGRWNNYARKHSYARGVAWDAVMDSVAGLANIYVEKIC